MKRILAGLMAVTATMAFAPRATFNPENGGHIVLPNGQLMSYKSSSCSQLYSDAGPNDIYPRQVIVDFFGSNGSESCLRGVEAVFEKSVSIDDLKAAIDQRYGKWAFADSPKLWRVEPQKFVIQLGVTEDQTKGAKRDPKRAQAFSQLFGHGERSNVAEAGMPQVIFIAFVGLKCSSE
jgi:hypothetical protein